jgi:hypothetical protein
VAVHTFAPVELVANTGLPMWSVRTKEMTPPLMGVTGLGAVRGQPPCGAMEVKLLASMGWLWALGIC